MRKYFSHHKWIGYLIKRIQHETQKSMDVALRKLKLTTSQYSALNQLEENPGLSNADLARKSFLTPQTMNQIILILEKKDLIKKNNHPSNAKIQEIYLSLKGENILKKAHLVVSDVEEILFKDLNEKEKVDIVGLLKKIKIYT